MSEDQQPSVKSVETSSSLLEDASTLLMFHNGVPPKDGESQNDPKLQTESQEPPIAPERPVEPLPKPATTSLLPSHSVIPNSGSSISRPSSTPNSTIMKSPKIKNIASPGPAIAALADSDNEDGENDNNNNNNKKSQKAIVAAAALAAAAGIPLPLINHKDQNSLDLQIIEKLRKNGVDSSEAILEKAQSEVSKEQFEALQERAEVISQGLKNKDKNESRNEKVEMGNQEELKNKESQEDTTMKNLDDNDTTLEDARPDSNETDVEVNDNEDTIMKDSNTTNDDLQNNNETEEETATILDKSDDKIPENQGEIEHKPKKQRKTKKKEPLPPPSQQLTASHSTIGANNTTAEIPQPVPKDYIVDPDAGIISCVCGYEDDDGFTIQCDNCFRWQHAVCMGIDSIDNAPDDYLCNVCSPRRIDVKKAKAAQTQRLNAIKRKERRNASRISVDADANDSSGQESSNGNGGGSKESNDHDSHKTNTQNQPNKEKETQTTTTTTNNNNTNTNTTSTSQTKPKPKPKPNSYGKNLEDDDIQVLDAKDSYKTIYYALNTYDYQDEEVYNFVNNLKDSQDPRFKQFTKSEFQKQEFPKLNVKPYSEVNNKKFNGISRLGLFTESIIPQGSMISEYLGEVGNKDKYISDTRNHYRIWGVEKPHVQFIPGLPLVIDSRFSGNSTRFIRRSCNANCELTTVIVSKDLVKFIIMAIKPIKSGSELTLNWNWDLNHPIRGILEGKTFDQINDAIKPSLVLSIESILTFAECGCTSVNECCIAKIKKASAHIYRATRKGNNTSGLKLLQPEAKYSSIQERLLQNETSNLRDSLNQVKSSIPLPSSDKNGYIQEEPDINIKPFIYGYLTKRRKIESHTIVPKDLNTYLPIPIHVKPEIKKDEVSKNNDSNIPAKPVKKLSFADYKKKKKPT